MISLLARVLIEAPSHPLSTVIPFCCRRDCVDQTCGFPCNLGLETDRGNVGGVKDNVDEERGCSLNGARETIIIDGALRSAYEQGGAADKTGQACDKELITSDK